MEYDPQYDPQYAAMPITRSEDDTFHYCYCGDPPLSPIAPVKWSTTMSSLQQCGELVEESPYQSQPQGYSQSCCHYRPPYYYFDSSEFLEQQSAWSFHHPGGGGDYDLNYHLEPHIQGYSSHGVDSEISSSSSLCETSSDVSWANNPNPSHFHPETQLPLIALPEAIPVPPAPPPSPPGRSSDATISCPRFLPNVPRADAFPIPYSTPPSMPSASGSEDVLQHPEYNPEQPQLMLHSPVAIHPSGITPEKIANGASPVHNSRAMVTTQPRPLPPHDHTPTLATSPSPSSSPTQQRPRPSSESRRSPIVTVPTPCAATARPKKYACTMCEKKFDRPSTLKKHMLVHTGEKAFKCDNCGRRFGVQSNLNRHARKCLLKPPSLEFTDNSSASTSLSSSPLASDQQPQSAKEDSTTRDVKATFQPRRQRGRSATKQQHNSSSSSSPSSSWIPASLRGFTLLSPTNYPYIREFWALTNSCPMPLPPAIPGTIDEFDGIEEERNSFDENVPPFPYDPANWCGKLPGPAVHKNAGPGANAHGQLFKWSLNSHDRMNKTTMTTTTTTLATTQAGSYQWGSTTATTTTKGTSPAATVDGSIGVSQDWVAPAIMKRIGYTKA